VDLPQQLNGSNSLRQFIASNVGKVRTCPELVSFRTISHSFFLQVRAPTWPRNDFQMNSPKTDGTGSVWEIRRRRWPISAQGSRNENPGNRHTKSVLALKRFANRLTLLRY